MFKHLKNKIVLGVVALSLVIGSVAAWAAYPSNSARTKTWGAEVLTASDLHTQFDILHTWLNAAFNATTGHTHDGTTNQGPKVNAINGLKVTSQAQGDLLYASSSSAFARLGAGTSGQFLKTQGASANPIWADITTVYSPRSSFRNLSVTRTNATTVAVTADELVLQDTSNVATRVTSVSVSAAITTSGANGLDTGTESGNTIYYVWVIRKSSDATMGALLSLSSSAPTMPSGYDQKALVSAVGNNNSSDFIDFTQTGTKYNFTTWAPMASGAPGVGSWTSVDMTPANMSTNPGFVPPALSNYAHLSLGFDNGTAYVTNKSSVALTSDPLASRLGGDLAVSGFNIHCELNIITADTLYYAANGSGAEALWLEGFELNKLT